MADDPDEPTEPLSVAMLRWADEFDNEWGTGEPGSSDYGRELRERAAALQAPHTARVTVRPDVERGRVERIGRDREVRVYRGLEPRGTGWREVIVAVEVDGVVE